MIDWLDDKHPPAFPPSTKALDEPNGLLAAGGRLSPGWLDEAYRHGIFPWNDPDEVRLWWSPAPRAVIIPSSFRTPRTVRKLLKRNRHHTTTFNLAFEQVIEACSEPRSYQEGTWIDEEILYYYQQMFISGRALSIERWNENGQLIGGCYGLIKGAVFYGESMFSKAPNASKLAFAQAAPILFNAGIQLIDCQMHTEHLAQFGASEISRNEFEQYLAVFCQQPSQMKLPTIAIMSEGKNERA